MEMAALSTACQLLYAAKDWWLAGGLILCMLCSCIASVRFFMLHESVKGSGLSEPKHLYLTN